MDNGASNDKPLVGVRGWLWLLTWGLIAIGPGLGILETIRELATVTAIRPSLAANPNWWKVETLVWSNVGLIETFGIVAGLLLLLRRKPSTPFIAAGLIAARAIVPPFVVAVALKSQINAPFFNPFTNSMFQKAIPYAMFAIGWGCYLLVSERVKNTYGSR